MTTTPTPSQADVEQWLVAYLAQALHIEADAIDVEADFRDYGLDSSAAVVLSGDLEQWLGRDLDPTLLIDHPTIRSVARHLGR